MIADLGTRRGVTIEDVTSESVWQTGFDWMKLDVSMFPVKTVDQVKLNSSEEKEVNKEMAIIGVKDENLTKFDWPHHKSNHSSFITLNMTGRCVPMWGTYLTINI